MVRELGFMEKTLAATEHPPSAVHALLEIDRHGEMTAAQIGQILALEKSSVSRLAAGLIEAGHVEETANATDRRSKMLRLTTTGRKTVAAIDSYAEKQVSDAMEGLTAEQRQGVAHGLDAYANALRDRRLGRHPVAGTRDAIVLFEGYRPGMVGRVTEMHARFYSTHSGFGQVFESQVASGMADFVSRLDHPRNAIWTATIGDRIVGSVAIDGQDLPNGDGHLRWFILDEGCRGEGIGRRLLVEALAFCDRASFPAVQLWTFKGLEAARSLYEAHGFQLTHEATGSRWGETVVEQQFTRSCRTHVQLKTAAP